MNFLCIFHGKLGRSKLMESPKLIGILKFVCQMGISDIADVRDLKFPQSILNPANCA